MPAPENGPGAGSPSAGDTTTLPALPYVPYPVSYTHLTLPTTPYV